MWSPRENFHLASELRSDSEVAKRLLPRGDKRTSSLECQVAASPLRGLTAAWKGVQKINSSNSSKTLLRINGDLQQLHQYKHQLE
jgi:hypothetical protein